MEEFFNWLHRMGTLHDVRVQTLTWDLKSKTLTFIFDDLYNNFEGFPEYPGAIGGTIVLHGVRALSMYFEKIENFWITEFQPNPEVADSVEVYASSGLMRVTFERAEYPECRLLDEDNPD